MSDDPRFRISAKQTAKNFWQLDGTVEFNAESIKNSANVEDQGDIEKSALGKKLLNLIQETEKEFRGDGRKIVGDEDEKEKKGL